jgi:hypothetical protein
MLDMMFQHPSKAQCDLYLCLDLRTRFIFKESTPLFLVGQAECFYIQNQNFNYFLKKCYLLRKVWMYEDVPNDVPTY